MLKPRRGETGVSVGLTGITPNAKQGWIRIRKIRVKQTKDFRNFSISLYFTKSY